MHLSVISPEDFPAREPDTVAALFQSGLERYHVRKPHATAKELERWLHELPRKWRPHLVLHSHHHLVDTHGLGGRHAGEKITSGMASSGASVAAVTSPVLASRACHDLPSLRRSLGLYDIVLLAPLFPSLSKVGRVPDGSLPHEPLQLVLEKRTTAERRTKVYALGGVTVDRIPACRRLGFDGVAVLGAVWQAPDPIAAFEALLDACSERGPRPRGSVLECGSPLPLSPD